MLQRRFGDVRICAHETRVQHFFTLFSHFCIYYARLPQAILNKSTYAGEKIKSGYKSNFVIELTCYTSL